MIYDSDCWVNCVPLTVDKLHHINVVAVPQTSSLITSLLSVLTRSLHEFTETLKAQQFVFFVCLLISEPRPILYDHNLLVLDLFLEPCESNRI